MSHPHKRRSPHEGGNGHKLAGWVQGDVTSISVTAHDLSRGLATLASDQHILPAHEVEWALWALYDCARSVQMGLAREGVR